MSFSRPICHSNIIQKNPALLTFRGFIELPQDKFEELVVLAEQVNAAHAAAKKAKREMDKIKRQLNKKKSEWNRLSLEANAIYEIS